MSNRFDLRRAGLPASPSRRPSPSRRCPSRPRPSAVNLGTASPFVVLGGSTVTNTGPSVLNGDLGVSPGTSLDRLRAQAVVNGATHENDAVAAQAQTDLTTAYNVAAGQPISPGNDLTGNGPRRTGH